MGRGRAIRAALLGVAIGCVAFAARAQDKVTLFHERGAPTASLLVIYGAGHAYLLRQMARESGAFRVEEASAYLK
jgi:hypothetical protein